MQLPPPFEKFRLQGKKVDAFESWYWHVYGPEGNISCEICMKAKRLRFGNGTMAQISRRCCEIGRPLYIAFIEEVESQLDNQV